MRKRLYQILFFFSFVLLLSSIVYRVNRYLGRYWGGIEPPETKNLVSKDQIADAMSETGGFYKFPQAIKMSTDTQGSMSVQLQYTFKPEFQASMEKLFHTYKPDYGAFVAMDATTGEVLSMVSYAARESIDNIAVRSTFPSASVFKVITAAAAIESARYSPDTVVTFNGRNHTLYKGNVLKNTINRWTRQITLKEAFAKSVNSVFGKIGAFSVGPDGLRQYADRFGFNRKIAADFPVETGFASIPDDMWGLVESASGFTRENTMSPLQGALIAAAIANDGVMMEPYLVRSAYSPRGEQVYLAEPRVWNLTVDPKTAAEIRTMMRQTVTSGTSSRSFRRFFRGKYSHLNVGGKTGSLTGTSPAGKYDWFVGYAMNGSQRVAFSALTINKKFWTVKSSFLARLAIEKYFENNGW